MDGYFKVMRSKVVGSAMLGVSLGLYGSYKIFSNRCLLIRKSHQIAKYPLSHRRSL